MKRAVGNKPVRNFAIVLMLAAVVGAVADVVGTIIDLGRAAEWCS